MSHVAVARRRRLRHGPSSRALSARDEVRLPDLARREAHALEPEAVTARTRRFFPGYALPPAVRGDFRTRRRRRRGQALVLGGGPDHGLSSNAVPARAAPRRSCRGRHRAAKASRSSRRCCSRRCSSSELGKSGARALPLPVGTELRGRSRVTAPDQRRARRVPRSTSASRCSNASLPTAFALY